MDDDAVDFAQQAAAARAALVRLKAAGAFTDEADVRRAERVIAACDVLLAEPGMLAALSAVLPLWRRAKRVEDEG